MIPSGPKPVSDPSGALSGRRILVLRPEGQADELARALEALGAVPIVVPAIRILAPTDWRAVDDLLRRARRFVWMIFTSVNGVAFLIDRLGEMGLTPAALPAQLAAVGPVTRQALERRGCSVAWVPSRFTTRALGEELPGPGAPVCLVRAEMASPDLERILEERGFEVERLNAYRTEPVGHDAIRKALGGTVDAIALTSASIAGSFMHAAGRPDRRSTAVISIGPATTEACAAAGLPVDAEADEHTMSGLVGTLAEHFAARAAEAMARPAHPKVKPS